MKIGVVGLGIAGLSAVARLAADGHEVVGFEQYDLLHARGSSHGDTRIFRRYPFEGGIYQQLADMAVAGWRDWSVQAGEDLIVECGGVYAAPQNSDFMADIQRHAPRAEVMNAAACNNVYGFFNVPADWQVLRVAEDAYVKPDATRAFLSRWILMQGGQLRMNAAVEAIDVARAGVYVDGQMHTFDALVIAAGGWMPRLVPALQKYLITERRTMSWYKPLRAEGKISAAGLPVFRFDRDFYGMPTPDGLIKIGHNDHFHEMVDMDHVPEPNSRDMAHVDALRARFLQHVDPVPVKQARCIYTMTPDMDFIVDGHPDNARVLLMSCCSGHGFKYGPAYGTLAADYFAGRGSPVSFALSRFTA